MNRIQTTTIMKTTIISIGITIVSLLFCNQLFGQWQPSSNGVFSNTAYCFLEAADGSIIVGTSNGIYRSTDSGDSWSLSSTGIPSSDGTILRFTANGSRIFAGTREGVYLSDDNGVTWSLSESFGFSVFGLQTLSNQVFAGTMGGGIFKSMDNGATWTNNNAGLFTDSIYSLMVNGSDLFAGTYGHGIFLSNDQGANWSQELSNSDPTVVRTMAVTTTRILAGVSIQISPIGAFNGLFRSTNGGQNWYPFSAYSGLPTPGNLPVAAMYASASTALLASGGQIYRSNDNGNNWTALMNGFSATLPYGIACFAETSEYIFCGVEAGGAGPIFRIPKGQVLTGINHLEQKAEINLFPNPSNGIQLSLDYHVHGNINHEWCIYDANGRLVFQHELDNQEGLISIPTTLDVGTYVSVVKNSEGLVTTESLVVAR